MSGGGNNATIAYPGSHWDMLWPDSFDDFQLDIVGFLAILGEGSVSITAQVAALSNLFYLPRLIPAPQALLIPARKATLEPVKANVTGIHSGNVKDHLNHVGYVLLGEDMAAYTVRCVEVKKKPDHDQSRPPTLLGRWFKGQPAKSKKTKKKESSTKEVQPAVTARATGPLTYVALLGCGFSITLFTASIVFGDGMSMLATILLSLLSTLVGVANKWQLKLARPASDAKDGDAVVRYPNGSYLVVKCSEEVARELFFAPEEIEYAVEKTSTYRLIALIGTLLLMLGVIALANARLELQFAWAGAYVLINIAQWIAAALPLRLHWDLSCYEVTERSMWPQGPESKNFTQALAKAIMFAGTADWVRKDTGAAPNSEVWDQWLQEAADAVKEITHEPRGELIDPFYSGLEENDDEGGKRKAMGFWSKLSAPFMTRPHQRKNLGEVYTMPQQWRGQGAKARWDAIKQATECRRQVHRRPGEQDAASTTPSTAEVERPGIVSLTEVPKAG
ncbi:hypothetical protein Tdes44962_MAKER03826 [Teratosphaeria destructans]|uniref:Uncharacterized protein n=1 Tax=Teratosphaeria destructans TaxID=418781 RepID=A0A9W7W0R2_9PEZI|nr:hypothetical protein Tdes44962_MAKER03826 [Teratosphaeria destructans]